jgi:hypothetical protein
MFVIGRRDRRGGGRRSLFFAVGLVMMLNSASVANGSAGSVPHSAQTTRSYARAYGYVVGRAIPRALPAIVRCTQRKGKRPLCRHVSQQSPNYNIVEGSPIPDSPQGVYCLRTERGVLPGINAVVIVSVTGAVFSTPAVQNGSTYLGLRGAPYAMWIPGGSNCSNGQFEIQTGETTTGPTGLVVTPSAFVSFSFVIPDSLSRSGQ